MFLPISKFQDNFTQEQSFLTSLEKSHLAALSPHSNWALMALMAIVSLGVIWPLTIHITHVTYITCVTTSPVIYP